MKWYTADFETTTEPENCHVWLWSICDTDLKQRQGNSVHTFLQQCFKLAPCSIWFHNLRFDSQFIVSYLLLNGYKYSRDKEPLTFNCLVNSTNQIYSLEIIKKVYISNGRKKYISVKFYDSLKKLPFPVKKVAKTFNLPLRKLEIDYEEWRGYDHIATDEEKEYISADTEIMARALSVQFDQKLTHMTIGGDAMSEFKASIGGKSRFENLFPVIDLQTDANMRQAYKGGWCYVNPTYQGKTLGGGLVFDVNSLYPWALRFNPSPIGKPVEFTGKYIEDEFHPLYIQKLFCTFKLKEGFFPTMQIKKSMIYSDTEYLTESIEPAFLTLAQPDLELFFKHYDVQVISWEGGYKFKSIDGIFNAYIDHWSHLKENSTGGLRQICKLMLNNLYGKFASNPLIVNKRPELDENGVVHWVVDESYYIDPIYLPVAIFCTAYARRKTITMAQQLGERFVYADTDSVHIIGTDIPDCIKDEVDANKLGYWKLETEFIKAKFVKAKTYLELSIITKEQYDAIQDDEPTNLAYEDNGIYYLLNVKCAGMNDDIKEEVTFDNFKEGFTSNKKLKPKNVKGGVILEKIPFTIKHKSSII